MTVIRLMESNPELTFVCSQVSPLPPKRLGQEGGLLWAALGVVAKLSEELFFCLRRAASAV